MEKVPAAAGSIYTLAIKLSVAKTATTVEVDAAALTLDTTSTTQIAEVSGVVLQDTPLIGRDFTQLLKFNPGANANGSLNGSRFNGIDWKIDGADNNDLWHNINSVNQGGVSGIGGVLLPIDAIDE